MGSRVRFIDPRCPIRSPSWIPTRVISSYTVPYGFLYGSRCTKFHPTLPHIRSHVSFISPRRPTRSPKWFPVWRISSHKVPYGFLYGPPSKKFRPIPHMESRVSFINSRRPIRSPLWFPVWGISFHTVPYGFLYGPNAENFSRCRLTWVPIVSYAFRWIPMKSHAETHMEIFNRINLVTVGWRYDRNSRSQVNCYS